jgi:predicted RNA-binding Zn-ribbon protein involved in translation (DUF1610 family)
MAKASQKTFVTDDQGGPVECLGMKFPNDQARREYYLAILKEKLKDIQFREATGFPEGTEKDILAISDPPYFTACPNPFLSDFIEQAGKPYVPSQGYRREPLAVDSSEGKSDPIYSAHSYHTKVPHKAIMRAILHYTEPGDIVLDGFAGSGMTGVAAQMCGHPDADFKQLIENECRTHGRNKPKWGARRAVLNDLSPAATFIAHGYNLPFPADAFTEAATRILEELKTELGWMYDTIHSDGKTKGRINYTVWSENFACPDCGKLVVFSDEALDQPTKRVRDSFPCPKCGSDLTKDKLQRVMETLIDLATGSPYRRVKFSPVLINYNVRGKKFEKKPDAKDIELLGRIARLPIHQCVPTDPFPIDQMYHGSRLAPKGFTHIHHLFLPRAAHVLGELWAKASGEKDYALRSPLLFFAEQAIWGMSFLARYAPTHFSQVNQ